MSSEDVREVTLFGRTTIWETSQACHISCLSHPQAATSLPFCLRNSRLICSGARTTVKYCIRPRFWSAVFAFEQVVTQPPTCMSVAFRLSPAPFLTCKHLESLPLGSFPLRGNTKACSCCSPRFPIVYLLDLHKGTCVASANPQWKHRQKSEEFDPSFFEFWLLEVYECWFLTRVKFD